MSTIEVCYDLFHKRGAEYHPVTSPDERKIEAAIRAADTNKRVLQAPDATQAKVLHDYLLQVPWVFPVEGHSIDFSSYDASRWDPVLKRWSAVLAGASNIYRVYQSAPSDARLHLAVSTKGARRGPAAGDQGA